jgi:hypothetical protein
MLTYCDYDNMIDFIHARATEGSGRTSWALVGLMTWLILLHGTRGALRRMAARWDDHEHYDPRWQL